jgi:hypothetical protein
MSTEDNRWIRSGEWGFSPALLDMLDDGERRRLANGIGFSVLSAFGFESSDKAAERVRMAITFGNYTEGEMSLLQVETTHEELCVDAGLVLEGLQAAMRDPQISCHLYTMDDNPANLDRPYVSPPYASQVSPTYRFGNWPTEAPEAQG